MESFSDWCTYDSLMNFRQISPVDQTHLKEVYVTLCCFLIAAAVGAYLHLVWNIGGLLTTFATFGFMSWLFFNPPADESPYEDLKRDLLFMVLGLLIGASLGPIIQLAIDFDASFFVSIVMGGAIICACFSGAAALARRREFLYLGALLSSSLSVFFWLQFASKIFGGDIALSQFLLYFLLLVLVGYTVVHTQVILHQADLQVEEFEEEEEEGDYGQKLHSTTNNNAM